MASRRADLSRELGRLEAPRLAAGEAYSRADNLIRQVDTEIRARQANELLLLGPSPLNPANWPGTLGTLKSYAEGIGSETADAWGSAVKRAELRNNLPLTLAALAIAAICLVFGRRWSMRIGDRVVRRLPAATGEAVHVPVLAGPGDPAGDRHDRAGAAGWKSPASSDRAPTRSSATCPASRSCSIGGMWLAEQMFPEGEPATRCWGCRPSAGPRAGSSPGCWAGAVGDHRRPADGEVEGWNDTTPRC